MSATTIILGILFAIALGYCAFITYIKHLEHLKKYSKYTAKQLLISEICYYFILIGLAFTHGFWIVTIGLVILIVVKYNIDKQIIKNDG